MPLEITPLILTFNEAANIERTLAELKWAHRVVVVDSGSSDQTIAIARAFQNVAIHQRDFDSHTIQWNHGLSLVETDWVLALDADYVLGPEFSHEIQSLQPKGDVNGFFARFIYCINGHRLSASLYPPRAVLFRRDKANYVPDGHTQLLKLEGAAGELRSVILHDDRKPLSRWVSAQDKYAKLEARHLLEKPADELSRQDRLRLRIFFAPFVVIFYLLIFKRLIIGGWPAWYYVFQRTVAELLLSLRLLSERESLEASGNRGLTGLD